MYSMGGWPALKTFLSFCTWTRRKTHLWSVVLVKSRNFNHKIQPFGPFGNLSAGDTPAQPPIQGARSSTPKRRQLMRWMMDDDACLSSKRRSTAPSVSAAVLKGRMYWNGCSKLRNQESRPQKGLCRHSRRVGRYPKNLVIPGQKLKLLFFSKRWKIQEYMFVNFTQKPVVRV